MDVLVTFKCDIYNYKNPNICVIYDQRWVHDYLVQMIKS
jgi:hypothetical protein